MSITDNRRAFFNYEILERFEAGIALQGNEVKSIRAGRVNISEAFVIIKNSEAFVHNMSILPYENAGRMAAEPTRVRKLLLHKSEIVKLIGRVQEKGLTLIPLNLHYKRQVVKMELGLGKGKKTVDKRETIKKRELGRELQRAVKNNR